MGLTDLNQDDFHDLPQGNEGELQAKFGALLRPEVLKNGRKLFTGYLTTNGVACCPHYKCWVVWLKPEKLGTAVGAYKHTYTHTHTHIHIYTDLYSLT